jgi:hypothetical protein
MKKATGIVMALALIIALPFCLSPPVYAEGKTGARTDLSFTYAPAAPVYFVVAGIEKLTGNQNRLTITVIELFDDGTENSVTESFMIRNNAADIYVVGGYSVYVDTKGNVQIRQAEVVGYK